MVKIFYISIFHLIERRKEGMIIINACSKCLTVEETIDHVLFTCTMVHRIWNSIFSGFKCCWVLPRGISELFEAWKFCTGRQNYVERLSFLAVIWVLWKERNRRCFDGVCSSAAQVVERARLSVASWVSILPSFSGFPLNSILLNWKEIVASQQDCMQVFIVLLLLLLWVGVFVEAFLFWPAVGLVLFPVFGWQLLLGCSLFGLSRISHLYC